jgi:hypothetical protein
MKHVSTLSKYLLLVLLYFGVAQQVQAQTPDAVFDQIAAAIGKGDATALSGHFSTTVEVTVPSADQAYSAQQASFVLKEFFAKNTVTSFSVKHKGSSGATWYANGVYASSGGVFDTNVFVKKVGDKYQITQIRFEAD